MKYKIFLHIGHEVRLQDRAAATTLFIEELHLTIAGPTDLEISYAAIDSVTKVKIPGLGTAIKIMAGERTIFFAVVRFILFGQFVLIHYFKTTAVLGEIQRRAVKQSK